MASLYVINQVTCVNVKIILDTLATLILWYCPLNNSFVSLDWFILIIYNKSQQNTLDSHNTLHT